MNRDYGPCAVCDLPMLYDPDTDARPHTYHPEGCPARLDSSAHCSCGGLMECHPECCPTCQAGDA